VEFVTTGKINFRDFANEIIKQLIRIAIQQAILKPLLQGFGSIFGGASGGAGIAGGQSILAAANGIVAANGIQPFAAGGIVNRPTLFKFAQGGTMQSGLMGEAGPEGILPLKRGRDGKLGVIANGGGAGTTINVSVDATGSSVEGDGGQANQLGKVIAVAVQQEMMRVSMLAEAQRNDQIRFQQLLLEVPEKPKPKPVVEVDLEAEEAMAKEAAEAEAQALADAAVALATEGDAVDGEVTAEGAADEPASTEIVMQEGESLADVKERMKREQAKAKKPTIPPELLNNANSYEDKVGVVRMVVQNDQSRVAGVIRSMIQT
jgi:hypothetical protein